jgi:cation/acetate symporter
VAPPAETPSTLAPSAYDTSADDRDLDDGSDGLEKAPAARSPFRGVVVGLAAAAAVLLIVGGPTIWVGALRHAEPLYPYQYPTIFSLPLAVATLVAVSLFDRGAGERKETSAFDRLQYRSLTGHEVEA